MSLLSWLLEALPSFPKIYQLEYDYLQQRCLRLSLSAQRALQIPKSLRNLNDQQLIDTLDFYKAIAQYPFNKKEVNFVEWIEDDIFSGNLNIQKHVSKIWSELIQTYLWQPTSVTHAVEEDFNIKTFRTHLSLFFSPTSFAGLILSFCEQDYPIEKIISSGILQDYHLYHIIDMNTLQRPFIILESLSVEIPKLTNYLERLNITHCGIPELPQISMLGKMSHPHLEKREIELSTIKIDDHNILQQFLNFFDVDFIFILTLKLHEFDKDCVSHFLETWIKSQREDEVEYLYLRISSHLHPSMHHLVFNTIGKHIPANICLNKKWVKKLGPKF